LPNQPRREALRGIALVAGTGLHDWAEQEIDVTIAPPGNRPPPHPERGDYKVGVIEMVGPETDFRTIVSGNAQRDGARITIGATDARVFVRVARTALWGAAGKFKAIYRVLWAPRGLRPPGVSDVDWVDDVLPTEVRAGGNEGWRWVSANPAPFSGAVAHQSNIVEGMHQHYFEGAPPWVSLSVGAGDNLFAYVFLDPENTPSEVMLQWNDDTWEHRAYWGENNIDWGVDGTASRRRIGPLPPVGRWVRLEVPAGLVRLGGRRVNGMAFTLFGGRATWDCAGRSFPQLQLRPLRVQVIPSTRIPLNRPVQLTVHAEDADTGVPVSGTVAIFNPGQAPRNFRTDTPFTFVFQRKLDPGPPRTWEYPEGVVNPDDPSYAQTNIPFSFT